MATIKELMRAEWARAHQEQKERGIKLARDIRICRGKGYLRIWRKEKTTRPKMIFNRLKRKFRWKKISND